MSTTHVNITAPSKNYEQVRLSLVYRLSELTLGSLLAAYSLGFVAAIAAHWDELFTEGPGGAVLLITQYASISLAFAYVTTSFYVTYHAGILTMPQLDLERLGLDFALAIIQALFFGFSVFRPWSFPMLLGISVALAGFRQRTEHRELAEELYKAICRTGGRKDNAKLKKFRDALVELLRKDFPQLSGWGPTGRPIWFSALSMFIVGLAIAYLVVEFPQKPDWPFRNIWGLRTTRINREKLITLEVVLVMVPVIFYGHRVFKQRATFLQPSKLKDGEAFEPGANVGQPGPGSKVDAEVDLQFQVLQEKLENICP